MRFTHEFDAIDYIFRSLRKLRGVKRGLDEYGRDTSPTTRLLAATGLPAKKREYVVVTGSKGKGSTTVIAAKLLQHLGHTVGMITSPHLVSWRERIRVNGRAIPVSDLLRIVDELAPEIDAIEATLSPTQYFSPQGIILAVALRYFDEQGVNVAMLEVGRGGRFDDVSVVPNKLSLFTPIMLEHTKWLGDTLERIAWHKAGVIEPYSYAYSVAQAPEVLEVLRTEAETKQAEFDWIPSVNMGEYLSDTPDGFRMKLHRYGEVEVSLIGRYQVENATLAVQGTGNVHGRLKGVSHGSPEYVEHIRAGLKDVIWPGRCHKLQDSPLVYIDAAINQQTAASLVEGLRGRLTEPVVSIIGVPEDKGYEGVYKEVGAVSDALILTETARNRILSFPDADVALNVARQYNGDVTYANSLEAAVEQAMPRAGDGGTVLIVGTLSIVADAMALWNFSYEII